MQNIFQYIQCYFLSAGEDSSFAEQMDFNTSNVIFYPFDFLR